MTSNLSQSNAEDPIDANKKGAERENVDDEKNFCRAVNADDSNDEKMPPNKDSSRFINEETEGKNTAPSVDYSSGLTSGRKSLNPESLNVIEEKALSNESRSSSPIADSSIPKDLSVGSKTKTRSPRISPERRCPSPMDTSTSSHKDSPRKSFNNFSTCK